MILSAIGMIVANSQYKSKGVAWGRPVAGACGIFTVLLAISAMIGHISGHNPQADFLRDRELGYFKVKHEVLAEQLKSAYPNATVLVITNERNEYNAERHDAMLEAFSILNIGKTFEVPDPAETEDMMMDMSITAEEFDAIMDNNSNCDLVVSTIGLPMDFTEMEFWKKEPEGRPVLVLTEGYVYDLKPAIQHGFIGAVIQPNPDAVYDQEKKLPKDTMEAFNDRFILITADNLEEMDKKYEHLFN
jgi:hypothetical protein